MRIGRLFLFFEIKHLFEKWLYIDGTCGCRMWWIGPLCAEWLGDECLDYWKNNPKENSETTD